MYERGKSYRNGNNKTKMNKDEAHTASQLEGKVALIIGGESENGRLLVTALAQRSANIVLVCAEEDQTEMLELQQEVESAGRHCLALTGDIKSKDFAQQVLQQIMQMFGRLDIFIDYSTNETAADSAEKSVFNNLAIMTAALDQISQT